MSRARAKGTALETLTANYLADRLGDDRIMRMPLHGKHDRGDIAGIRTILGEKVTVEVKNHKRLELGTWLREAEIERGNADAAVAVVVHKRHGKAAPEHQLVTLTLADFTVLLGADKDTP